MGLDDCDPCEEEIECNPVPFQTVNIGKVSRCR